MSLASQKAADVLAGLSLDDKRALYDRIGLDLSGVKVAFERLEVDTWESISNVCRDANRKNMTSLVQSYGRKRYAERCNDVEEFITESCAPALRLVVRNAVRTAVLRCLVNWMKENEILVSVPTLLNCIQYLPGAVDMAFPGYAGAKLLHRVAPQLAA